MIEILVAIAIVWLLIKFGQGFNNEVKKHLIDAIDKAIKKNKNIT